jgi:hypothetical protein
MGRYDDILYQLIKKGVRNSFERMSRDEINIIIEKHPGVPADYIEYLEEIGYGSIGDNYFMVYGGLVEASEIYDESKTEKLKDIVFWGDYYNGHSIGFSKKGEWEMVDIDGRQNIEFLNTSFESYIKNKLDEYLRMLSYR